MGKLKATVGKGTRGAVARSRKSSDLSSSPAVAAAGLSESVGTVAEQRRRYWFTGRYIVVFSGHSTSEAVSALKKTSGLSVASSSDFVDRAALPPGFVGSAVYLESLGVAIADAPPEQLHGLGISAANRLQVVPERYMFVAGSLRFERAFLEGYRAGVNGVLDDLLKYQELNAATGLSAASLDTSSTWNLVRTGVSASKCSGRGVKLALLDTGYDQKHPDLSDRVSLSECFVPGSTVQDVFGHGTHCVGTAAGLVEPRSDGPRYGCAGDSELMVGKVLGDDGHGDEGWLLNGINWALEKGADIISLSIEGPYDPASAALPQYEAAGTKALAAGRLVVAAAGNYSIRPLLTKPVASPACANSIMSVGAIGADDRVAPFSCASSPGGAVDLSAPGVSIESSFPNPRIRKVDSGTSMAAPLVAGIAALHMEAEPGLRGRALWDKLLATANGLQDSQADVGAGCVAAP